MNLIDPSYEILTPISEGGMKELLFIELIARTCYKSEANSDGDFEKTKNFIKGLINNGHTAMIEHSILTVKFIVDRGVSHELVRHRHLSFAQESTRYCNYSLNKFGNELTFVKPSWYDKAPMNTKLVFEDTMSAISKSYMYLTENGLAAQDARADLPNALKTEIVATGNYREWRHVLSLRAAETTGNAHPNMVAVMKPLLEELHDKIPVIFDDIYEIMASKNK